MADVRDITREWHSEGIQRLSTRVGGSVRWLLTHYPLWDKALILSVIFSSALYKKLTFISISSDIAMDTLPSREWQNALLITSQHWLRKCRQVTKHILKQYRPRSLSLNGINWPHEINQTYKYVCLVSFRIKYQFLPTQFSLENVNRSIVWFSETYHAHILNDSFSNISHRKSKQRLCQMGIQGCFIKIKPYLRREIKEMKIGYFIYEKTFRYMHICVYYTNMYFCILYM